MDPFAFVAEKLQSAVESVRHGLKKHHVRKRHQRDAQDVRQRTNTRHTDQSPYTAPEPCNVKRVDIEKIGKLLQP